MSVVPEKLATYTRQFLNKRRIVISHRIVVGLFNYLSLGRE